MKKIVVVTLAVAIVIQMALAQNALALSVSESSLSQIKTDLQKVLTNIDSLRASIQSVIKKINALTGSSSGSDDSESGTTSNILEISGCEKIECPEGKKVSVLEYDSNGCVADYQCKASSSASVSASSSSSSSKKCPKARTIGEGCNTGTVWAKNPGTGGCCKYSSSCAAPADWKTYSVKSQCTKSSSGTASSTTACKTACKKYGYSLGTCRSECEAEEAEKEEGASSCPDQKCCCME